MSNMLSTIAPKTDQQNFDDFIGGVTKTIKITGVKIASGDQPVALNFDGDEGKPYKPGKSMRRVLVHCWGADANKYIGRSLTLYGDPKVKFGGAEVGGIRISHMSDIEAPITMALTATRAQRKAYTVNPLVTESQPAEPKTNNVTSPIETAIALCKITTNIDDLEQIAKDAQKLKGWTKAKIEEMANVLKQRRAELKQQTEERQPGE